MWRRDFALRPQPSALPGLRGRSGGWRQGVYTGWRDAAWRLETETEVTAASLQRRATLWQARSDDSCHTASSRRAGPVLWEPYLVGTAPFPGAWD